MVERQQPRQEDPNKESKTRFTRNDHIRVFGREELLAYEDILNEPYEGHMRRLLGLKDSEQLNVLFMRHGGPLAKEAHATIFLSAPTSKEITDPFNQITHHILDAAREINTQAAKLPGDIVVYLPESHLPFASLNPRTRDEWVKDAHEHSDAIVHVANFTPNTPGDTIRLELGRAGQTRPAFVYMPENAYNAESIRRILEEKEVKILRTPGEAIASALEYVGPVLTDDPRKGVELSMPPDVWLSPDIQQWYRNIINSGMELSVFHIESVLRVGPKKFAFFKIADATIVDPTTGEVKKEIVNSRPHVKAMLAVYWNDETQKHEVLVAKEKRLSSSQEGLIAITLPGGSSAKDTRDMVNMRQTAIKEFEEETGIELTPEEKESVAWFGSFQLQEAFGFTQHTFMIPVSKSLYERLNSKLYELVGNADEGEALTRDFVEEDIIVANTSNGGHGGSPFSVSLSAVVGSNAARRRLRVSHHI